MITWHALPLEISGGGWPLPVQEAVPSTVSAHCRQRHARVYL